MVLKKFPNVTTETIISKLLKLESGFDIKETFTEESREKEFWSKSRRLLRASPEKPISKSIIEENLPGAFWRLHLKSQ